LWTGKPVDWNGRWKVQGGVSSDRRHIDRAARQSGVAGAVAGVAPKRTGRLYDGWFPNSPSVEEYPGAMGRSAGGGTRCPGGIRPPLTGAMYLTLAIDDDAARAGCQAQRLSRAVLRPCRLT